MRKSILLGMCMFLLATLPVHAETEATVLNNECVEITLSETDASYWEELQQAELHNWKIIRNIPTAFEKEGWDAYAQIAPKVQSMAEDGITEEEQEKLKAIVQARKSLVQVKEEKDFRWYIWGEDMPVMEEESELVFDESMEDEEDFRPFLVPYLLEDQENVKGNMIIVAGGGYSSRANKGEGYPIAEKFNELGYNSYVLQRRVAPYGKEDIWMDMQRSVRYLRYHAEELGLGRTDRIEATGFSGGSFTVLGVVQYLYGDVQPSIYDPDYESDEIDVVNADLDGICAMYGPNPELLDEYTGMVTDNPNLPDMFIAVGQLDTLISAKDTLILAGSVFDKTRVEYHLFADTRHGFSHGIGDNNSHYWMNMADEFLDRIVDEEEQD